MSRLLMDELRPGDLFVDGGASFGWYTALAMECVGQGGVIYAIEANRRRARVLADDLRRARAMGTAVVAAALGATPGNAVLRLPETDSDENQRTVGAVGVGEAPAGYATEVITLDSLGLPRLDVLKLDIEGAEFDALTGAKETIQRCQPRLLVVEAIEENLNRFGHSVNELAALVETLGYTHEQVGGPQEAPMWVCRRVDSRDESQS